MLHGIESICLELRLQCVRLLLASIPVRQKAIEKATRSVARAGHVTRERAEPLQVAPLARRKQSLICAQQSWQPNVVVAVRQNRFATRLQLRKRPTFVNREVINDRLHRKRHAARQSIAHFSHQIADALLCLRLALGIEDESHSAARHSAQHPESPERIAKLRAYFA